MISEFQMVRENILLLNEVAQFGNEVGARASLELAIEVRLLANLRKQFFDIPPPPQLAPRVLEEAKTVNLTVWSEPSLEEKRRWFISVPFHEEYFTPCRVMWIKVIIRAAYDYALWRDSSDLRQRKYAHDAAKWLFDEDDHLLNSFKSICFLCRLPEEELKVWARKLTRAQVKKFEFLERNGKDFVTAALRDKRAVDGYDQ